ncbi:MAG: hypothetical protein V8Q36_08075 [Anaerotignum sp.]
MVLSCSITLKKGEGRILKAGGLWVFDNEIAAVTADVVNGELISVQDFDGYPMGTGFYNNNSKITIRMMSRHADAVIDEAFLRRQSRGRMVLPQTDGGHLFLPCYFRGSGLPARSGGR